MNTRELIANLEKAGFEKQTTNKHLKLKHPDGRWTVISKGNKEIGKTLLKQIEKQTGVKLT